MKTFSIEWFIILSKNKDITKKIRRSTEILQDSPLLLILFLFYNLLILKELKKEKDIIAADFADDIAIWVKENLCKENFSVLLNMQKKIYKP